ncbi:hypothetical protein PNOK_0754400 [Pyrrhoderma noxium]|uniref:Uncharacterized protein n=1 Tax=Pyrrhoderma noxium TaxID=2282107 RepID=A0A286UD22_9AGAM|nr:hypothetical protein PNOK_0754400 [Pyrrhoderma noxium]
MPLHIPGSHASSSIQTYNDVGGTQINGGNVTMTDGRNVVHRVSSTEEGTQPGDNLGDKQAHRGVSATETGDKPVVGKELMKEVANENSKRDVAHRVSSTEEGTKPGDSLASDSKRVTDGNKPAHSGVPITVVPTPMVTQCKEEESIAL